MVKSPLEFILIAGTNGAGKSTAGEGLIDPATTVYLNPDAIQRTYGYSNAEVGRRIIRFTEQSIVQRWHSLAVESTLSGTLPLRQLALAANHGFKTKVFYIGLASVELHIQRVKNRVASGGHAIAEVDIRRRISKSYANLVKAIQLADEVEIFDNSALSPVPLLKFTNQGNKGFIENSLAPAALPDWAANVLKEVMKR